MAKTKTQKRTEAKKVAETLKAKKKAIRMTKATVVAPSSKNTKKGRSGIPQAKKK